MRRMLHTWLPVVLLSLTGCNTYRAYPGPKRPTAQAAPPPEAQATDPSTAKAGPAASTSEDDDDDDPYSAALRDMIRSEH